jgi:hypothetical protein
LVASVDGRILDPAEHEAREVHQVAPLVVAQGLHVAQAAGNAA